MRTALGISALRVPMIMQQVVPFVGLFAAMATLVSLNRKYELVIARAAGISAWQFLLPACLGALLFGVLTVGVLNPLAAYGFSRAETMETALRAGHSNAVTAFDAPWIRQNTDEGDTIIGARAVLNQGLELADAIFFRFDDDGDIVERLDAKRAFLREGYWELHDVERLAGTAHRRARPTIEDQDQPPARDSSRNGWRGPKPFPFSNSRLRSTSRARSD